MDKMIRVRILRQCRFSPDGHNIKDYYKGDELVVKLADAKGTLLFKSEGVGPMAEQIQMVDEEEPKQEKPKEEQRGPRPDAKDMEEMEDSDEKKQDEEEKEDKQEKEPVDPHKETEKIENKEQHSSSKLKNKRK